MHLSNRHVWDSGSGRMLARFGYSAHVVIIVARSNPAIACHTDKRPTFSSSVSLVPSKSMPQPRVPGTLVMIMLSPITDHVQRTVSGGQSDFVASPARTPYAGPC